MAETKVMDVEVVKLTKFGFQDETGGYVGYSNYLKDSDKAKVVPGRKFSVEVYVADSGSKKINKILKQLDVSLPKNLTDVTVKDIERSVIKQAVLKEAYGKSETMSKAEWSAKDRSQLIGGLSHDAATLTAALSPVFGPDTAVPFVLNIYKQFLEGMLKIRDEVK